MDVHYIDSSSEAAEQVDNAMRQFWHALSQILARVGTQQMSSLDNAGALEIVLELNPHLERVVNYAKAEGMLAAQHIVSELTSAHIGVECETGSEDVERDDTPAPAPWQSGKGGTGGSPKAD